MAVGKTLNDAVDLEEKTTDPLVLRLVARPLGKGVVKEICKITLDTVFNSGKAYIQSMLEEDKLVSTVTNLLQQIGIL